MQWKSIPLPNGNEWFFSEFMTDSVCIPIGATTGMSNEEIGASVRTIIQEQTNLDVFRHIDLRAYSLDSLRHAKRVVIPSACGSAERRAIIDAYIDHEIQQREELASSTISRKTNQPGFVYLAKNQNVCKIGISKNPGQRLKAIRLSSPIELIHTIQTNEMRMAEAYFHSVFEHRRVNGEWFALTTAEVDWIKSFDSFDPSVS